MAHGTFDQHTMGPSGEIMIVPGMVGKNNIKDHSIGTARPYSGEINRDIEIDMHSGRK